MQAATLIAHYRLEPHPEGGYYRETWRSDTVIAREALPEGFSGPRHCSTAILFLLENRDVSRLHRIRSDEIWHFYGGGPLRLAMIFPNGTAKEIVLGQDIEAGQYVQYVVPAGVWFLSAGTRHHRRILPLNAKAWPASRKYPHHHTQRRIIVPDTPEIAV